jgi:hypothetical protein
MNSASGGLGELPSAVGPSDHQQETLKQQWDTYSDIESYLIGKSIMPLTIPIVGIPEITPALLQGLNDDQYMEVYNALDAWNSYISETVSQIQNMILQTENEMDDLALHVEQNLKTTAKVEGKKPSAEDVKFTVKVHPRNRALKLELQRHQQALNRLSARQKTLARAERLLSRNIELIKLNRESAGGSGGLPRRGSPAQMPLPPRTP